MESQENTTQNVLAENTESAPVTNVTSTTEAVTTESAPVTEVLQNTEVEGAEPSKTVKELIAQRKRRQQAEMEREYWRGIAEARANATPEKPVTPVFQPQNPPTAPVLDDFETFEEYEKAKDEYVLAQAEQRMTAKLHQQELERQAQMVQLAFQQKIDRAAQDDPEIRDIVNDPYLPISQAMVPVLQQSDAAPELLRYLNANRQEAARIARLSPIMAARELGIIEAKLTFNQRNVEPPKKVSQAPEPIPTLTPTGSVAEFNPETASMEEYYRYRMAQIRGQR